MRRLAGPAHRRLFDFNPYPPTFMMSLTHDRVVVETRFGTVAGGRLNNGAVVFLGKDICCPSVFSFDPNYWDVQKYLMPFHLKDSRIPFPCLQSFATKTKTTSQRVPVSLDDFICPNLVVYVGVDLLPDAVQPTYDGQIAGVYRWIRTFVLRYMS